GVSTAYGDEEPPHHIPAPHRMSFDSCVELGMRVHSRRIITVFRRASVVSNDGVAQLRVIVDLGIYDTCVEAIGRGISRPQRCRERQDEYAHGEDDPTLHSRSLVLSVRPCPSCFFEWANSAP